VVHPASQFLVGPDGVGVDAEPALHLSPPHHELVHVRLTDQRIAVGRINAQQQAALAAGTDGHVAVDQEGEPAEHASFRHAAFRLEGLSDPVRELGVVCHAGRFSDRPTGRSDGPPLPGHI
jgi:hypothetical protein